MKKKIVCVFICLVLMSTIPLVSGLAVCKSNPSEITGFRVGKVFGIFPSFTDDQITFIMILPPFGKKTIDQDRFSGRIGILFIYGQYQWFEDGPPVLP